MSESLDRKTLAGLRCLVAVAKADGSFDASERAEIAVAFAGHEDVLDQVVGTPIDLDAEIAALSDDDGFRRQVYRAAFAVAYADGKATMDEVNTLKRIYPDGGEDSLLSQVLGEARDTLAPMGILPVADPVQRDAEILEDTFKYAVLSAVVGANPFPGVAVLTDLMVVGFQVKLVRDIGQYWGHELDGSSAKSLIGTIAGGAGLRIAVNNLMKFVPGWGSAFGAATSFASTFAVGQVANAYFESGRSLDPDAMKNLFEKAKNEGRQSYQERQADIDAATVTYEGDLAALREKLVAGELSVDEATASIDQAVTTGQ
ncbi:MAG: hypothetical protein ACI8PZ_001975 [Myxococcota bacterium]|jgi:uncharacterized protein (DUF697 family)